MDFITILNEYSLIAVLVGAAVCILTGIIKLPIKNALNKKVDTLTSSYTVGFATASETDRATIITKIQDTQKKYNDMLKDLCVIIALVFAAVGIVLYHVFTNTLTSFTTIAPYREIITSYIVSEFIFAAYEKIGIKTLALNIMKVIRTKITTKSTKELDNVLDVIENILANDVKLPLTTNQQKLLREKYTEQTTKHK